MGYVDTQATDPTGYVEAHATPAIDPKGTLMHQLPSTLLFRCQLSARSRPMLLFLWSWRRNFTIGAMGRGEIRIRNVLGLLVFFAVPPAMLRDFRASFSTVLWELLSDLRQAPLMVCHDEHCVSLALLRNDVLDVGVPPVEQIFIVAQRRFRYLLPWHVSASDVPRVAVIDSDVPRVAVIGCGWGWASDVPRAAAIGCGWGCICHQLAGK